MCENAQKNAQKNAHFRTKKMCENAQNPREKGAKITKMKKPPKHIAKMAPKSKKSYGNVRKISFKKFRNSQKKLHKFAKMGENGRKLGKSQKKSKMGSASWSSLRCAEFGWANIYTNLVVLETGKPRTWESAMAPSPQIIPSKISPPCRFLAVF